MRRNPIKSLTFAALAVAGAALLTPGAHAQWDPANGDWGKSTPTDVRVMTWNILNSIAQGEDKTDELNSWNAVVRIVASLEPDVLILQEVGNGSSVSSYENLFDLFINGGDDNGQPVTSYLKLFKPSLDYHVFISTQTDSFNRNVILSRYPFADLNCDVSDNATLSDVTVLADGYAPGINGGIRGYAFAEIDLPDDTYLGDLVVGNGHLKAFSGCPEANDRETAARNVTYFIDHFFNGAGTGSPDPNNRIPFDDGDTVVLDPNTPVIWGGDINATVSESTGCTVKSPVLWFMQAQNPGGTSDGPDRDGTDCARDAAADPFDPSNNDSRGGSDIDHLFWQDSIATSVRDVIFDSSWIAAEGAPYPFPLDGYPPIPSIASGQASDHRAVFVDFQLPLGQGSPPGCAPPHDPPRRPAPQ